MKISKQTQNYIIFGILLLLSVGLCYVATRRSVSTKEGFNQNMYIKKIKKILRRWAETTNQNKKSKLKKIIDVGYLKLSNTNKQKIKQFNTEHKFKYTFSE